MTKSCRVQSCIPKYMPNTIAAPKKAPRVWKKKNNGNFLQGSFPSKHNVKVTAGFRWPPKDVGRKKNLGIFLQYLLLYSLWCTLQKQIHEGCFISAAYDTVPPLFYSARQKRVLSLYRIFSNHGLCKVLLGWTGFCDTKLNWRDEKIQKSILFFSTLKGKELLWCHTHAGA